MIKHIASLGCILALVACTLTDPNGTKSADQSFLAQIGAFTREADAVVANLSADAQALKPQALKLCAAIGELDGGFRVVAAASSVVSPEAAAVEGAVIATADTLCADISAPGKPTAVARLLQAVELYSEIKGQAQAVGVPVAAAPPK